uniref:N-acetyltransferase domain-containing protein n=1 Tax=viral metagenome TaxID=1070528 RepID=A0A6C0JHR3_9ZZZZ
MNFYSDKLKNNIIDTEPIDNILEALEDFQVHCRYVIVRYSMGSLSHKYSLNLLKDDKNIVAFHCLDNVFDMANCPSILIYRKQKLISEIHYYILFACTKRNFRGQGYASKLLTGFIERIKEENGTKDENGAEEGIDQVAKKKIRIVLSSVESAVVFYEEFGFRWTRESLLDYPFLMRHEKYNKKHEYFILEYIVTV